MTIWKQNKNGENRRVRQNRYVAGLLILACLFTLNAGSLQVLAAGAKMMYALEAANVYAGPGNEYEVTGQLAEGETIFAVELLEEGWYRVVYNGETAYVKQDYLALYSSEAVGEENTLVFPDAAPPELEEALTEETLSADAALKETVSAEAEQGETALSDETTESTGEKTKKPSHIIAGLALTAGFLAIFAYAVCLIWKEKKKGSVDEKEKQDREKDGGVEETEDEPEKEKNDLEFLDWNGEDEEDK